ncbi:cadmium-translocating P-type ATPase [Chryseobacterium sp. POL2]|uniref:heavy metal translocating P-type ATPase n=1 Tax=Chryseobacterium sp. POL2 TaxID=2713414 RepID=UPI0013E1EEFD|nr:heavy metal translocating P-type ATPase [Chryseobacterium sp. POL2]QIG88273.1 cadmium-translocating P-type ATPase [Chryseobacterium sp. POL2]
MSNKECCSNPPIKNDHEHSHSHDSHDHSHETSDKSILQLFAPAIISFVVLIIGILFDYYFKPTWFEGWSRIILYAIAYLPVGWPVIKEAFESMKNGDIFSEFFLMSIATIGAIIIGEYPEAVAVMLFYSVGEIFQSLAVQKAKNNIASLMDQRPDEVTIIKNNQHRTVKAKEVNIGQKILLKPGEKLALDGELFSEQASFNTSALTGESKPDTKQKGDEVLAGMINLNSVAEVLVKTDYQDSKLSKILELVQNANQQKAPTELFIRKFAKIYTPIVTFLALGIFVLPYLFVEVYDYKTWLYRACIFLVISCPCALVISIPLGYFGGIGAGSKNGILFKGGNFIDALASIKNVVMDKTGTLTEGVFKVKDIQISKDFNEKEILEVLNKLESHSTHPIATAIHEYVGEQNPNLILENIEEIPGRGLKANYQGKNFLAGNFKLMEKFGITHDLNSKNFTESLIAIAFDNKFVGYITISDQIKPEASTAIAELKKLNINSFMLSGDKKEVVESVAQQLQINHASGGLLPEDKVAELKKIRSQYGSVAFVGDGVNDAPVVALADVGMAMGGLGSDATIETADVVIQDDKATKIPLAIKISKATKKVVWQNIILAFGVKAIVLILGAGGLATMWEAVFADVGVALLAILNAVRIQNMNFKV